MYPIERDEYIKAHIAAISHEMQQARLSQQNPRQPSKASRRFGRTIARILRREEQGHPPMMNPVPHS